MTPEPQLTPTPEPQSFSLDQIYRDIITPLQQQLWQLALQIMMLRNQNAELVKRIAELSK